MIYVDNFNCEQLFQIIFQHQLLSTQILNLATDDQNCHTTVDTQANVIIILLL